MLATSTPQHYFAGPASGARLRAARAAARRAWPVPVPLNVGLKLARHGDKYVITAATPGVKADHIQLALVGNRHLRLQILQPHPLQAAPTAAASAAASLPEAAPALAAESVTTDVAGDGAPADAAGTETPGLETSDDSTAASIPASAPYYAGEISPAAAAEASEETAEMHADMVVILEKSLALPQPVDGAGISCTYADGLVCIEIPVVDPAPDAHVVKLQEELSEAAAQLAAYEKQVQAQREKVQSAHAALRKAKSGACLSRRTQRLTIDTAKNVSESDEPAQEH